MISQSKKYLTYIMIFFVICLLIMAAAWLMVFKINQVASQIKEAKTNLAKWQKKHEYFRQLSEEYEKIGSDLEVANQGFLSADQIVSFIEELENLGRETQISQEIKNATIKEEDPASLVVSLLLEGDFSRVFYYLVLIENMAYYNEVNELQITRAEKRLAGLASEPLTSSPVLKVSLELTVFLAPLAVP